MAMLEWIQSNWVNILAVIGGLYAAARAIVALTPTPKDDEALSKVGTALKALAKLMGLDLKQGVTKDSGGSKGVGMLILGALLVSLFLTGCGGGLMGETGGMGGQGLRIAAEDGSRIESVTVNITDGGTDVRGDVKSDPLVEVRKPAERPARKEPATGGVDVECAPSCSTCPPGDGQGQSASDARRAGRGLILSRRTHGEHQLHPGRPRIRRVVH